MTTQTNQRMIFTRFHKLFMLNLSIKFSLYLFIFLIRPNKSLFVSFQQFSACHKKIWAPTMRSIFWMHVIILCLWPLVVKAWRDVSQVVLLYRNLYSYCEKCCCVWFNFLVTLLIFFLNAVGELKHLNNSIYDLKLGIFK